MTQKWLWHVSHVCASKMQRIHWLNTESRNGKIKGATGSDVTSTQCASTSTSTSTSKIYKYKYLYSQVRYIEIQASG